MTETIDIKDKRYTLLSEDLVFGEGKSPVIDKIGTLCQATDYAVVTGAQILDGTQAQAGEQVQSGAQARTGEERPCRWFLRSAGGYGDVCAVNEKGERVLAYVSSRGSIRPVLPCPGPLPDAEKTRRDISGFLEVEHGEYPQAAADKDTARVLESECSAGRLRKTGKMFAQQYEEYISQDRKYIRAEYQSAEDHILSDGRSHSEGDPVWIEVTPVSWFYDEKNEILISRNALAGGITFGAGSFYDGAFEMTEAWRFLNESLAEDLSPSLVEEMSAEEKAAYEEEMKKAARRRNPYGLTFGEVSEEDIIRGALESDIAVFLHGPSSEGKSARIKQIDPTCEIVYLRNATPDSLNGRSVYNQATGEMIDIPPTWYKKVKAKCEAEPDTFHVVFFDEINNALPSIQGMAFNIVLDREVNGLWKLPSNARVVAAGNDMQDSLAANQIAAPFFNRFAHVYINTTTEKWLKWAREHHIHPAIYAYIAYKKGETLRSTYTGEKPNADPRKWEMASRMLYKTGRPEMLRALIGEEITDEFVQFCNQPVITLDQVLAGDVSDREIEGMNTAERYATTVGLSQAEESQLETVRAFVSRLGEEFRTVFDSMRYPK